MGWSRQRPLLLLCSGEVIMEDLLAGWAGRRGRAAEGFCLLTGDGRNSL